MWRSRSKDDLVIEVWEKLDCESVGRVELEAITEAVLGLFGEAAVDTPMTLARKLADEGAELRHSEVMELHLEHFTNIEYEAEFRNIVNIADLRSARKTLRDLENLRRKFQDKDDKRGLRLVLEAGRKARESALAKKGEQAREIAEWFRIWLQSPELFESWIRLRTASANYNDLFGEKNNE